MAAVYQGFRESQTQRSALRVPRPLPFLLIGSRLIAPWPTARVLSPEQSEELLQVLAALKGRGGNLPPFAWVTIAGEVTAMPEPEASWISRRLHDGHVVTIGPPTVKRAGDRIPPDASRVFRELAGTGMALQP